MSLYVKKATSAGSSKSTYSVSTQDNGHGTDRYVNGSSYGYQENYRSLSVGTEYLLYNYVYEYAKSRSTGNGVDYTYNLRLDQSYNQKYARCNLSFKRLGTSGTETKIYGNWSPDSVATSSTVSTWGTYN